MQNLWVPDNKNNNYQKQNARFMFRPRMSFKKKFRLKNKLRLFFLNMFIEKTIFLIIVNIRY